MANKNKRGPLAARTTGAVEGVRNHGMNREGNKSGKARPQTKPVAIKPKSTSELVFIKESLDTAYSSWRSANTRFHKCMWAYVQGKLGLTKGDIVYVAGNKKTSWKIIDCTRAHNKPEYNLIIQPIKLVGSGDTAYHKAIAIYERRVPLSKLSPKNIYLSDLILLARPNK